MDAPGKEGIHSEHRPQPFTLGKGKSDGERGRGREKGGMRKKKRTQAGEELMADSFLMKSIYLLAL